MSRCNATMGKKSRGFSCSLAILTVFLCLFSVQRSWADEEGFDREGRYCSKTAYAAWNACRNELKDDYWIAVGNCNNLGEREDQRTCLEEAGGEWRDARPECRAQLEARLDICEELGEEPYDPDFEGVTFVDPASIPNQYPPNQYFPLVPGNTWTYEGETEDGLEIIVVTVTDRTRLIEYPVGSGQDIECTVVQDVVTLDGVVVEDTFDWYAQDQDGNVWYMGEIAKNYEDGELADVEGSWKAGQDSAKPGIVMFADPDPEQVHVYRQEFALGNAEDMGALESRDGVVVTILDDNGGELFSFVDGVLVTRDFTPIEPDVYELKYYAPGIGLVLEENPETGEMLKLVGTNLIF